MRTTQLKKMMPSQPIEELASTDIARIVALLTRNGIKDFKLTGGDPILRPDIVEIVTAIKEVPGVRVLDLVTRHDRAGNLATDLKKSGLDLLNFSLDSLDSKTWSRITRSREDHGQLIAAIRTAGQSGIHLRINTVLLRGVNDHEVPDLIEFAAEVGAELKLLDLIPDIGEFPGFDRRTLESYYIDPLLYSDYLSQEAQLSETITQAGGLGHPMPRYTLPNGVKVSLKSAKLGAFYGSICADCQHYPCHDALMALRVTANGLLHICLLRDDLFINALDLASQPRRKSDKAIKEVLDMYQDAVFIDEGMTSVEGEGRKDHQGFLPTGVKLFVSNSFK